MRRPGRALCLGLGSAIAGCVAFGSDRATVEPVDDAGPPGAPTPGIDAGPCDPLSAFVAVEAVAELNTPGNALGARLLPDELTVFYGASQDTGPRDLYRATRTRRDVPFGNILPLSDLSTPLLDEGKPTLTSRYVYFHRSRPKPDGGPSMSNHDIWVAEVNPVGGFGSPAMLPAPVVVGGVDLSPFVSPDGEELFFSSVRSGRTELWHANGLLDGGAFSDAGKVDVPSVGEFTDSPVLAADRLVLYFGAGPIAPTVDSAIWVTKRASPSSPFESPRKLSELDAKDWRDEPSWISPDHCTLYFFSNRSTRFEIFRARRR